jgi:catalase (peroxidase I)
VAAILLGLCKAECLKSFNYEMAKNNKQSALQDHGTRSNPYGPDFDYADLAWSDLILLAGNVTLENIGFAVSYCQFSLGYSTIARVSQT